MAISMAANSAENGTLELIRFRNHGSESSGATLERRFLTPHLGGLRVSEIQRVGPACVTGQWGKRAAVCTHGGLFRAQKPSLSTSPHKGALHSRTLRGPTARQKKARSVGGRKTNEELWGYEAR